MRYEKILYLKSLSDGFIDNKINPEKWKNYSDEEIIVELTKIKGIGRWTAEMFLMFTLNRPDVFPVTDLGIQKGFQLFFQLDEIPNSDQMIEKAEPWVPYRTLASWYLWRLVEGPFEW